MSDHREIEDPEKVIERLLQEIRWQNKQFDEIREAIGSAGYDLNKLSMPGAIKRLALDCREAKEHARKVEGELERLIRSK
jgi:Tfp pilus assembly protein PilN